MTDGPMTDGPMTDGPMTDGLIAEPVTCELVAHHLEGYLAGELGPGDESRLARHLTGCAACAAEAGLAQRVAVELASLPAFDAPPDLIARIKASARREPAPVVSLAARRPRRFLRSAALAAALLAALGLGWWQVQRPASPSEAEIAAAEQEARYALALIARVSRKAGAEVHREVLVERVAVPVLKSMGRPFERSNDRETREGTLKTGGLKS